MPWFAWLYCAVFGALMFGLAWVIVDINRIVREMRKYH